MFDVEGSGGKDWQPLLGLVSDLTEGEQRQQHEQCFCFGVIEQQSRLHFFVEKTTIIRNLAVATARVTLSRWIRDALTEHERKTSVKVPIPHPSNC
jgi:hypothetical protein